MRRVKDLNTGEAEERELEDGWVEANNPMQNNFSKEEAKKESMDIDDMDANHIIDGGQ